MGIGWMRTLGTVSGILTLVAILVGLIVTALAYFRKGKTRATLLWNLENEGKSAIYCKACSRKGDSD